MQRRGLFVMHQAGAGERRGERRMRQKLERGIVWVKTTKECNGAVPKRASELTCPLDRSPCTAWKATRCGRSSPCFPSTGLP